MIQSQWEDFDPVLVWLPAQQDGRSLSSVLRGWTVGGSLVFVYPIWGGVMCQALLRAGLIGSFTPEVAYSAAMGSFYLELHSGQAIQEVTQNGQYLCDLHSACPGWYKIFSGHFQHSSSYGISVLKNTFWTTIRVKTRKCLFWGEVGRDVEHR